MGPSGAAPAQAAAPASQPETGRKDKAGNARTETAAERREAATRKALTAAVRSWAKAWSKRDAKAYLAAYAPGFVSADRTMSHATWADERRRSLRESESIRVDINQLEWDSKGEDWVGSFVETSLIDGRFREQRKQLLMRKVGKRWLIVGEREDG